jgi:hypothetical protein
VQVRLSAAADEQQLAELDAASWPVELQVRKSTEISFLPSDRETNQTICNTINFDNARFTGSVVDFRQMLRFQTVDFRDVWDWSHPPKFDSDAQVLKPSESGETPS